jgi:hypothetical protein
MSGLKHFGHVVGGVSEKGDFNPAGSSINFAVPSMVYFQNDLL